MQTNDLTILIKNKKNGNAVYTTVRSFDLLTNRDEWEIVEPEMQATPPVEGKAIRAADVAASEPEQPVALAPDTIEKPKRGRRSIK